MNLTKKRLLFVLWVAIPAAFIAAWLANTIIAGTFVLFLASHLYYIHQAQKLP